MGIPQPAPIGDQASPAEMPATPNGANQYSMIGKSIVIKGQIEASDPIYVYGVVEGSISAPAHRVTVGKEGTVNADIAAREVVIMGEVCGKVEGGERVEIRSDGSLVGDVSTKRIYVEEGAVLSGSIKVHKPARTETAESRAQDREAGATRKGVMNFPLTELEEEIA